MRIKVHGKIEDENLKFSQWYCKKKTSHDYYELVETNVLYGSVNFVNWNIRNIILEDWNKAKTKLEVEEMTKTMGKLFWMIWKW